MTSIAIVGPGAIGGTLAAWLAQNPNFDVTVCARSPMADLVVETPEGTIKAAPKVLTDASLKADTVHPNAAGYRIIAERLAERLKRSGAI